MSCLGRVLRSGALRQLRSLSGKPQGDVLPPSCDVLIIGGGGMGASSAFWLKSRTLQLGKKLNVLVVERDAGVSTMSLVLNKKLSIKKNWCHKPQDRFWFKQH